MDVAQLLNYEKWMPSTAFLILSSVDGAIVVKAIKRIRVKINITLPLQQTL